MAAVRRGLHPQPLAAGGLAHPGFDGCEFVGLQAGHRAHARPGSRACTDSPRSSRCAPGSARAPPRRRAGRRRASSSRGPRSACDRAALDGGRGFGIGSVRVAEFLAAAGDQRARQRIGQVLRQAGDACGWRAPVTQRASPRSTASTPSRATAALSSHSHFGSFDTARAHAVDVVEFGVGEARAQRGHVHAARPDFQRQAFAEADQPGLGGAVQGVPRRSRHQPASEATLRMRPWPAASIAGRNDA